MWFYEGIVCDLLSAFKARRLNVKSISINLEHLVTSVSFALTTCLAFFLFSFKLGDMFIDKKKIFGIFGLHSADI